MLLAQVIHKYNLPVKKKSNNTEFENAKNFLLFSSVPLHPTSLQNGVYPSRPLFTEQGL